MAALILNAGHSERPNYFIEGEIFQFTWMTILILSESNFLASYYRWNQRFAKIKDAVFTAVWFTVFSSILLYRISYWMRIYF